MLIPILQVLFERDLLKLKTEIELYHDKIQLGHIQKNISNADGNLCVHLLGNLPAFITTKIGKTSYVCNRELTFLLNDDPKKNT